MAVQLSAENSGANYGRSDEAAEVVHGKRKKKNGVGKKNGGQKKFKADNSHLINSE